MSWLMRIPYSEFTFEVMRSRGPGGQNVNRTNTAVALRWSPLQSVAFSLNEKEILRQKLSLNLEEELLIRSEVFRSQDQNKSECLKKLEQILTKALFVPKKRYKTKPTRSSKVKRVDSKKRRAVVKQGRRKVEES